jgi:hypothetical protein
MIFEPIGGSLPASLTQVRKSSMAVEKPFKRTCRQLADGTYRGNGNGGYVRHPQFVDSPQQYIRAFQVLQKDMAELFDYVEPADKNRDCFSYRIHELRMRLCIEVEANCVGILRANGYQKSSNWTMDDYKKLNATHRLSSYIVRLPIWRGVNSDRVPFGNWGTAGQIAWYQAYNQAKHSRHENFHLSNFDSLVDSMCGLVAILASQFITDDFGQSYVVSEGGAGGGFEYAIGGYFLVKFPQHWPLHERYSFDWSKLHSDPNPTQTLVFK